MKKGMALAVLLMCGARFAGAHDYDNHSLVTWRNIVGVITAPGVDNPVAVTTDTDDNVLSQIHSGTRPWVTRSGSASVDLTTGAVRFDVRGLVLNGGNATGTAGPINEVTGTLVCNPGSTSADQPQTVIDTPPVALSVLGNARFHGELTDPVPTTCANPLFLIRIGPAFEAFAGRWLATGVEPRVGSSSESRRDRDRDREDDRR